MRRLAGDLLMTILIPVVGLAVAWYWLRSAFKRHT